MNRLITALLFTSALVCAQTRTPPDPATMAQREVKFLTNRYTLTAAQQSSAVTIFTAQFTADAATRASLKTARTNLTAAIETPNNTNTIQTIANEIGTLTATLTASDANAQSQFYALLTTAQQTIYNQHPGGGMGMGMGGGRGMGRFGGRPQ